MPLNAQLEEFYRDTQKFLFRNCLVIRLGVSSLLTSVCLLCLFFPSTRTLWVFLLFTSAIVINSLIGLKTGKSYLVTALDIVSVSVFAYILFHLLHDNTLVTYIDTVYSFILVFAFVIGEPPLLLFAGILIAFTSAIIQTDQSLSVSLLGSVYYLLFSTLLWRLCKSQRKGNNILQKLIVSKLVSGAHYELLKVDGVQLFNNYAVFSAMSFVDKDFPGGDFVKIREVDDGILVIAGDVISHGVTVSHGSFVCLSVFLASHTTNTSYILRDINRVLYHIKRENGGEAIVSCLYLKDDGRVFYSGGMERMAVQRLEIGEGTKTHIDELTNTEIILGQKPEIDMLMHELQLNEGDNLLIASDGAIHDEQEDDRMSIVITFYNNAENMEKLKEALGDSLA